MKAKHYVAVLAIGTLLIPALWAVVRAAEKPDGSVPPFLFADSWETLRGLQGVQVVVEKLHTGAEQLGLTEDQLQTDTELQLRQYGIRVLSQQEIPATPGQPWLYVNVNVLGADDEKRYTLAVSITIQLRQLVYLARSPAIRCTAATWQEGGVIMIPRAMGLDRVRGCVKDDVARFVNDYLAANPKQPAPTSEGHSAEAERG